MARTRQRGTTPFQEMLLVLLVTLMHLHGTAEALSLSSDLSSAAHAPLNGSTATTAIRGAGRRALRAAVGRCKMTLA